MKKILKKAVLLAIFAWLSINAEATTYYLNFQTGSDVSGNGSLSNPWKTLNHAFQRDGNGNYVNSFASGDVVQLSAHTFIEIGQFNVPVGVSIEGAGIGQTILKASSAFYYYPVSPEFAPDKFLITLSSSGQVNGNQSLKNFTIDGDEKKLHGGIYVNRSSVLIENVRVQYVNFSGIWLNGSNNSDLVGLQLKDCAWGSSGWCSAALQIANSADVDVHGFDINEGRGYGIKNLGHVQNAPFANIKIHDGSVSVNPVGLWNGGAAPNISIEFWGGSFPGTEIYNCYVDNHISLVNDGTGQRTTSIKVHDNVFDILGPRANGKGYGLELSINDADVYNNWFYGGDNGIVNWAQERKYSNWNIHHNTFYFNRPKHTDSTAVWPSGVITTHKNAIEDVIIANNTVEVVGETMDFLVFDNRADPVINPTSNNITVTKNLIIDSQVPNGYAHWENRVVRLLNGALVTNVNVSANAFQDITGDIITGVTYANNISGDPLITKVTPRPDPYYRLQSNSPLVGLDIGAYGIGGANVVDNPEFDNGTTSWMLGDWSGPNFSSGGSSFSVVQGAGLSGNNAAYVDVVTANSTGWTLQLMQQLSLMLQEGKTYEVRFMAKAESARTITAALHGNTSNTDYWTTIASLTTTAQNFGPYTFTCNNSGAPGEASFNTTFFLSGLAVSDVWIDNVTVRDITTVPVTSVSVSPVTATLAVAATVQLAKTIAPANATNQNVTWSTSNAAIATVNSLGLVTGVAAGSATITVTTADGNQTATSTITVVVPVTSVTVSPTTATVAVGSTQQVTRTIAPANATNQNVTWSTSNASIATVSAAGLVTAVSAGSATITVTTADGSKTATATITVVVPVTSVTVSPATATKAVGSTQQLTKTIAPANATNQNVTWSTSNASIATVSAAGLVTAVSAGSATITVTTADGSKTATATITVVVPVTSVTMSPATATKAVGSTQQLTKTIAPANATNQNVTWTTSNASVATVSATGLVTAVSNGSAVITVTTADGSKTASSTITVVRPVTSVTVSPTTATKAVGTTQQLTKTIAPANATNQNVTWTTSNASIATVNTSGLVTAVSNGTATITVTTVDGNKTATSTITVVRSVTSVTVSPATASIAVGSTQQLTKTIAPANATNQNVTWSTNNASVATVNAAGLVTGVSAGNATITVTTVDGNKTATSVITVVVPVTGVTVSPNTATVVVGNTQQLTNAITPSNATNQNVTWSTSSASIATVNSSGLVTAVAPGSAAVTVTTSNGNHTATAWITVPSVNVVVNPEFDNGTTSWMLGDWSGPNFSNGGNSFSVVQSAGLSGSNAAYVNIVNTNTTGWTLQLMQQLGLMLQVGKTYEVSFMAKAESARSISAALHGNTTDVDYWTTTANLTTTAQNFGPYTFTCNDNGVSGQASFNITFFLSSTAVSDVWIDKVSVRDVTTLLPPEPEIDPDGRMATTPAMEEINETISKRFQAHPNPIQSGDVLYLNLPGSTGELKITDMMGRVHYRSNVTKLKQEISTEALSQGLYLLEYHHSAGRAVIKVIIK